MEKNNVMEKSLFIKSGPTIKRVMSSDILYIQCDGNVSHLYMLDVPRSCACACSSSSSRT